MSDSATSFDLMGKIAVVTGGAGILGSQFVKTLIGAGARVAVLDIKSVLPQQLQWVGSDRVKLIQTDITIEVRVRSAFEEITRTFGVSPDILINNAGLDAHPSASAVQNGPFEQYELTDWQAVMDSHLTGAFLVSKYFLRNYLPHRYGSIINISSIYGLVAPDQSMYNHRRRCGENFFKPISYSVAKAGLIGFTKALAEYCGPSGIRVNALVPGGVFNGQDEEFVRVYSARTMLGRMAECNELNGALLFLASEASRYMTGSVLVVDGGLTAR